jgi:hypothetical protein
MLQLPKKTKKQLNPTRERILNALLHAEYDSEDLDEQVSDDEIAPVHPG